MRASIDTLHSRIAPRHILIEAGTLAGPSTDPTEPRTHFFVSMVTGDDPTRVWEGQRYDDAVRIAHLWSNWTIVDATGLGGAA